jgi:peptidoglycan/xylan/chitin deacetylase (PgdA/CDA1 family)
VTPAELPRPIVPITAVTTALALGAWLLPEHRVAVWCSLAAAYLALCTWGTGSIRSGIFGRALSSGDRDSAQVALTFDDGPDPRTTPAILDLLEERGVKATFFCVGDRARAHPDVVKRCHAEGHGIGNHSQRHRALTNFQFGAAMKRELAACQATLAELTGEPPRYYRPPMGLMNHAVVGAVETNGLRLVGWQARGLDTTSRSVEQVTARILADVRPGGILLLHDGEQEPERAVAIATGVLDGLAEKGLEPVRLNELLAGKSQAVGERR